MRVPCSHCSKSWMKFQDRNDILEGRKRNHGEQRKEERNRRVNGRRCSSFLADQSGNHAQSAHAQFTQKEGVANQPACMGYSSSITVTPCQEKASLGQQGDDKSLFVMARPPVGDHHLGHRPAWLMLKRMSPPLLLSLPVTTTLEPRKKRVRNVSAFVIPVRSGSRLRVRVRVRGIHKTYLSARSQGSSKSKGDKATPCFFSYGQYW